MLLRKVFRKKGDEEEQVSGLIDIKKGEVFRMAPPDGIDDDSFCPKDWMRATEDGYVNADGVQAINCEELLGIMYKIKA